MLEQVTQSTGIQLEARMRAWNKNTENDREYIKYSQFFYVCSFRWNREIFIYFIKVYFTSHYIIQKQKHFTFRFPINSLLTIHQFFLKSNESTYCIISSIHSHFLLFFLVRAMSSSSPSFLVYPADTDFPLQNLPYGVYDSVSGPHVCTALGDHLIDLHVLATRTQVWELDRRSGSRFLRKVLPRRCNRRN